VRVRHSTNYLARAFPRMVPSGTPGTRQVTIGGAIAADVHGKNHHVDGSFARHVIENAHRDTRRRRHGLAECRPRNCLGDHGRNGLTGVITAVTLNCSGSKPIRYSWTRSGSPISMRS